MIVNVPYIRNQKKPTMAANIASSMLSNVLKITTRVIIKANATAPLCAIGMKTL